MDCSLAKTNDPEEWLECAPEFSRAMAVELRERILQWEPDLSEGIKWNLLCFTGRKLVCGISACKRHLSLAFFRGKELQDHAGLFHGGEENTAIQSIRITTLEGFDFCALKRLLHAATALGAELALPPPPKQKREPWPVPDFFTAALKKDAKAAAGFAKLSPSCQREYLVWLSTAKRSETRAARLAQTLAALKTGKRWAQRKP